MTPQAIAFDTLDSVRRLVGAGFSEQQAEVQTRIIAEVVDKQLATKQDLEALATREDLAQLDHKIDESSARLDRKIDESSARLDRKIDEKIAQLDHKIDEKIDQLDHKINESFTRLDHKIDESVTQLDRQIDTKTTQLDRRMDAIDSELKLIKWMLALVFAVTVLPALKTLFGLLHRIPTLPLVGYIG